jgi:hypothetical protein
MEVGWAAGQGSSIHTQPARLASLEPAGSAVMTPTLTRPGMLRTGVALCSELPLVAHCNWLKLSMAAGQLQPVCLCGMGCYCCSQ